MVVARARNGDYYSPWSAPVTLKLFVAVRHVERHGRRRPRTELQAARHAARRVGAGGRVTVAIAKGKKGKRFRTMGKAKVNSKGIWTLRFTVRKYGYYRVRYSFAGTALVPRGAIYEVVRIRRIFGSTNTG